MYPRQLTSVVWLHHSFYMKKYIIGKKIGMTQTYTEEGRAVPVTEILISSCTVTQVKTQEKDGYVAVQFGYGLRKEKNMKKPQKGHVKDLGNFAYFREFRVEDPTQYAVGDVLKIDQFAEGELVNVSGTTVGKGFQGVVKRHGFSGSPASHGHKDQLRMPGSIGAGGPQRVFKGTRMGGQMGNVKSTTSNLKIIKINPETNSVFVKGAVPGSRNSLVAIFA